MANSHAQRALNDILLKALIAISVADIGVTFLGTLIDPAQLPSWLSTTLAWVTIGGGAVMLLFTLYIYLFELQIEGWRMALLRFVLLYLCLLCGFASLYYLIKDDFKVQASPEAELKVQQAIATKDYADWKRREERARADVANADQAIPKEKPEWLEAAHSEFEAEKKLEEDRTTLEDLLGRIGTRKILHRTEPKDHFRIFSIEESEANIAAMEEDLKEIDAKKQRLSQPLIAQYKAYAAKEGEAKQRSQEVHRILETVESQKVDIDARLSTEKGKLEYFTFVYFSAITMSTVGYGDIYPGTRQSRFYVTLQVLLGTALVLVYLSLVMGKAGQGGAGRGTYVSGRFKTSQ